MRDGVWEVVGEERKKRRRACSFFPKTEEGGVVEIQLSILEPSDGREGGGVEREVDEVGVGGEEVFETMEGGGRVGDGVKKSVMGEGGGRRGGEEVIVGEVEEKVPNSNGEG